MTPARIRRLATSSLPPPPPALLLVPSQPLDVTMWEVYQSLIQAPAVPGGWRPTKRKIRYAEESVEE